MATYDYSRAFATAQRLVERYGRPVRLQGVSPGPADPNNPLGGSAPPPTPIDVWGTAIEPSSLQALGFSGMIAELFASCSQIFIVALNEKGDDYSDMKYLYDGIKRWKISRFSTLKPGDIVVLHFFGVNLP